jgi:hypothetical protein
MSARVTLAAVAALAGMAALSRRSGSRAVDAQGLYRWIPELRRRWYNEDEGEDVEDPDEVEDFFLSDHPWIPDGVQRWWEQATGTRYLGHGNYRVVVSLGDGTVAKFSLDSHGEDENSREVEAWDEYAGTPVADFLAPMIWGSDEMVVMRQAEALSMDKLEADPALALALKRRDDALNALGLQGKHNITDTAHPGNWGILDGKIVLIDYPEDP